MEKDIGKINKNDTTDIVVRVDDFGGVKGVTIREFVTSDRYTGFTKSGVRIMATDFPKFKEMVNAITDEDLSEESGGNPGENPEQKNLDVETEKPGEEKGNLPDY
tara:strand:+ start:1094 stop:1408 length:315 start_codon:yes stop_codon:yes gene_type:complete